MQFVSESTIDKAAETIGSAENLTDIVRNFKENQPVVLAYLFSENFNLLTQKEREYMMFLALVIWESCEKTQAEISEKLIEDLEEKNWEMFHKVISRKFNEKINIFFKNYPQEDLLAFVEDGLAQDEDSEITKEGRDYIFIALKTIIDSLDARS